MDSMSPTSPVMHDKFFRRKTSQTGVSVRSSQATLTTRLGLPGQFPLLPDPTHHQLQSTQPQCLSLRMVGPQLHVALLGCAHLSTMGQGLATRCSLVNSPPRSGSRRVSWFPFSGRGNAAAYSSIHMGSCESLLVWSLFQDQFTLGIPPRSCCPGQHSSQDQCSF